MMLMTKTTHKKFILFAVIFFCANLSGCAGLLFQPMKPLIRTPADINLAYQDVVFPSQDGTNLHGWFLPAEGEALGTVLLLHGNAEARWEGAKSLLKFALGTFFVNEASERIKNANPYITIDDGDDQLSLTFDEFLEKLTSTYQMKTVYKEALITDIEFQKTLIKQA